ncbi:cell division protein FtsW [Persephonella hydrogeniphila]|uniref:Probable peptidoglycan glycosyltransferase FtsW n=1 Tax=Persephonella hydrogeniphila TaxID=198703 RepID=A0A285N092_9AQUI|nr:putative lipid II flippase FtsW [Persephonella hydrogeniphila]SNZ02343.1 cell division protein FtsW [Persephonella hydrogeniphila]
MIRNFYFDKLLVLSFLILIILGVVFVFSATSVPSLLNNKDPYFYLKREILWAFLAVIVMFTVYLVPIEYLKKLSYPLTALTVILLIVVLVSPAQISGSSVKRWLDLGVIRFQPSELAKLSVILFLAYFIHRKSQMKDFFDRWSSIFAAISIPSVIILLVLIQPHKGAAVFISILVVMILFSAGFSLRKLIFIPAVFVPLFIFFIVKSGYAEKRIEALINPIENRTGISYQVFQSILSFVKGGFVGEGIGAGTQKLKYLPEIHTDYIFALIGEELGFLGAIFVILLFLVILYRGIKISLDLEDRFSQVLGTGITYMIVVQALFHMAVNASLFPPTGFTLPFISYGGSSLIIMSIGAGILLRLSKEPKKSIYSRQII